MATTHARTSASRIRRARSSIDAESFDHIFVCFVLEHLAQPLEALAIFKQLLRPGGTITVIEGDHGSTYFYPDSAAARVAIECQVTLQQQAGGNALIGRQLYPLLVAAGFESVRVAPRMVYKETWALAQHGDFFTDQLLGDSYRRTLEHSEQHLYLARVYHSHDAIPTFTSTVRSALILFNEIGSQQRNARRSRWIAALCLWFILVDGHARAGYNVTY